MILAAGLAGPPGADAASFSVASTNTNLDTNDAFAGNGVCADSSGRCSLRAAIEEANALAGADTVLLPDVARIFSVTQSDLVITSEIAIQGASTTGSSVLRGQAGDRVISVLATGILTMRNVVVEDGSYSGDGGNIRVSGEATLISCTVQDGSTDGNGGGISVTSGTLTLSNTWVVNNQAAHKGGGLHATSSSTINILANSRIAGNTVSGSDAGDGGGGVYGDGGTVTIDESTILNNSAESAWGGGAHLTMGSQLILDLATIDGNSASAGGGVYTDVGGDALATRSAITNNVASTDGGGLYLAGGHSALANSTISGNTARANGGGVLTTGSATELELSNVTLANNTADLNGNDDGSGGGVYNADAEVVLRNTVLADNDDVCSLSPPWCAYAPDCDGELTSDGHNIIGLDGLLCSIVGDTTGNQVRYDVQLDPGLAPLTDESTYATEFHPLELASPAYDLGNPSGCVDHNGDPLVDDQRGELRPVDIRCDIGAYEAQAAQELVIFTDGFETGDDQRWTTAADVNVASSVAHRGHYGMEGSLNGAYSYVEDATPDDESRYRARFSLNPDAVNLPTGHAFTLFAALSDSSIVQARLIIVGQATGLVVEASVRTGGGLSTGPVIPLTDGWQQIELDWLAAPSSASADGHLRVWHEGTLLVDLTDLDNDGEAVGFARVGVVDAVGSSASGALLIDDFVATRAGLISLAGDVDRDSSIEAADLVKLLEPLFVPGPEHPSMDVNGDRTIDAADLAEEVLVLDEP